MKIGHLNSAVGNLHDSLETLQAAWDETQLYWNDENSRKLQEHNLEPIGPRVKNSIDAIGRLGDILRRAEREFEDDAY